MLAEGFVALRGVGGIGICDVWNRGIPQDDTIEEVVDHVQLCAWLSFASIDFTVKGCCYIEGCLPHVGELCIQV